MIRKTVDSMALFLALAAILSLPAIVHAQSAERPTSDELLPETTVAYVQLHNVREFVEKMRESNGGQMLQHERIAPLANEFYQAIQDEYAKVEDLVGLSLEEIQSLPAGEICFAVIAPKRKSPVFLLIIDTDEESETVEKALQRGRDLVSEQGLEMETEELDEVTFEKVYVGEKKVTFFRRGGTLVVGADTENGSAAEQELNDLVTRWNGEEVEKVRPLKGNRKFVTIMNRCRGTREVAPDLRYFVDPIKLVKSATRGNVMAQGALNFLPILGLDGFLGFGGSSIMNELDFEYVSHMHVLLANPRSGIFEMLALKPGTYEPQPWVPDNAVLYLSTSWDVGKMFNEFEKIYDSFSGDGSLEREIEDEINSELGIDFKADFIDQLSGRITLVQWVGEEIAINGQTIALGVGLNDTEKFMDLMQIFFDKIRDERGEDAFQEVEFEGITYWKQPDEDVERGREMVEENVPVTIRVQQPCFAIVEDHFIVSDSTQFMERAIETVRGRKPPLYDDSQFKYVSRQMTRLLGSDVPGAVMYSRPEETLRMFFEVANGDDTKEFLDEMAEENQFIARLRDALDDNPLPDFDEVRQYFPPSGAFVTNDETGYHLLGFQLKSIEDK